MSAQIVIKTVYELTEHEVFQINEALFREFKVPFTVDDETKTLQFFLLKQQDVIVALGALQEVRPVIFNGENFVIYAVLHVVSNMKGKGFGKQVVVAMNDYLSSRNKTILGFCMPRNAGFYEKCGFTIDTTSTQRFVYTTGNKRITNQDGQCIFYKDSTDEFMKKVLANPTIEVSIPTQNLW